MISLPIDNQAHILRKCTRGGIYCSFASSFIPSITGPVTLLFRYCLVGAPCGGASFGIVGAGSGCWEAAREVESWPFVLREGVPTRGGIGLGAFAMGGRMAGDW